MSVQEQDGGSITAEGVYTAPEEVGTYHVVATSVADETRTDVATIVVPRRAVADCGSLPEPGTWENITPPEVTINGGGTDHGVYAFAVDPFNSGTVYLGTIRQKVWKTTDCGSTWTRVATGRNGNIVDSGMNWTFVLDPTDSQVLYTNSGYGQSNGAFKSTNGGVDWDPIWPPPNQPELKGAVEYDFANVLAMDPLDNQHLLLTFHAVCKAPYNETCIGETFDGGATWRVINGHPSWRGTEGQVVYFLDNSETWLWGSQSAGFWRTEDSGATWTRTNESNKQAHPQSNQMYRAKDGTFYLAASDGVSRSADGKNWSLIEGTGPLAGGLVSDGVTMYLSVYFYSSYGNNLQPYFTAPEAEGEPWSRLPSPGMTSGGVLGYDPDHRLLYSSNFQAGFFRVVLPPLER